MSADATTLVRAMLLTLGRAVRQWVQQLQPLQKCKLLLLVPESRNPVLMHLDRAAACDQCVFCVQLAI